MDGHSQQKGYNYEQNAALLVFKLKNKHVG